MKLKEKEGNTRELEKRVLTLNWIRKVSNIEAISSFISSFFFAFSKEYETSNSIKVKSNESIVKQSKSREKNRKEQTEQNRIEQNKFHIPIGGLKFSTYTKLSENVERKKYLIFPRNKILRPVIRITGLLKKQKGKKKKMKTKKNVKERRQKNEGIKIKEKLNQMKKNNQMRKMEKKMRNRMKKKKR